MQKPRVLVVEDNSLVALDICQSLTEYGYEVAQPVSSGEQAISVAQSNRPNVVIMDIRLAGAMDGVTAAAHISDTCDVPVIFLTAHADKSTLERAKIVEPFAYILKPFENIELHAAIQMLLYQNGWQDDGSVLSEPPIANVSNLDKDFAGLNSVEQRVAYLKNFSLFADLQEAEISQLAHACQTKLVSKGTVLADAETGEAPAFLVHSGRIVMVEAAGENAASESASKKRELFVEIVEPGDLFGLVSAVDTYPVPVIPRANRDSQVLIIPKRTFVLLLEAYPTLAISFAEYVTYRLRRSQAFSTAIAYDDVQTRIASTVIALAERHPSTEPFIYLDITRKELAQLTGTTVETVVRVLKILEQKGLVELGQRKKLAVRNPRFEKGNVDKSMH